MSERSSTTSENGVKNKTSTFLSDEFIQGIWVQLAGQFPREHICQIATRVASEFKDARVTTFLPIFIRRQTLERLEATSREGE